MEQFEFLILLLDATLRVSVPLVLAAMAGLFSERSGIVDIGLEGKMLAGAFAAAAVGALTGSVWLGLLAGVGISVALGMLHGYACITHNGNQVVSGVAINIIASGLTVVVGIAIFSRGGQTPQLPQAARFTPLTLPGADAVADVFQRRTGNLVRPLPWPIAMPLVEQVYSQVLAAGGYPYYLAGGLRSRVATQSLEYILFTQASEDQLQHVNAFEYLVRSEFEVMIVLYSQENTRGLSSVDPARQSLLAKAYREMVQVYQQRSASGDLRWAITLYPTQAVAQDAEMSLEEFEDYVYATTYSDTEDPVAEWNKIHDQQQVIVDWLKGKREITVKGSNIDLRLSIEGRDFINSDGKKNMPSGEVFTSPVEDSAEGWVRFTYPAIRAAREVEGIELTFEKGRVIEATAEKNEPFLQQMLDTDEGARRLGEFAIGTNKMIDRFIKNILFDEKIGGTIHMALGFGFPQIGGENESAIHWDMICDMREDGQIFADGERSEEHTSELQSH